MAVINGTEDPETLTGGDGNDVIKGFDDRDTLFGLDGDDRLYGGDGNDRLDGGDGNDRLDGGAHNDYLVGRKGNDVMLGGLDNDRLVGGAGNDSLYGGDGNDRLEGGAGADIFGFDDGHTGIGSANRDRIADFSRGEGDKLDVDPVDVNLNLGGDQDFVFRGTAAFTGIGQIRVVSSGADRIIQFNNDSDLQADFEIVLQGSNQPVLGSDFGHL